MQTTRFSGLSRRLVPAALLLVVAGLAACKKEPARAPGRHEIVQHVPIIPSSNLLDTTGTPEAEQRAYLVVIPFDSAAKFYPDTLRKLGWSIESAHQGAQSLDLYARKDRDNLWVRLEGQTWEFGVKRTYYTLIAATAGPRDSTAPPQPRTPRHATPAVN